MSERARSGSHGRRESPTADPTPDEIRKLAADLREHGFEALAGWADDCALEAEERADD